MLKYFQCFYPLKNMSNDLISVNACGMANWRRSTDPDEAVGCAIASGSAYSKLCPGGALSAANVAAMAALALGSDVDRRSVLMALANCSETIDGWVVAGAAIESDDPNRLDDLLSVMDLDIDNPRYVQTAVLSGKSKSLKWFLDRGAAVEDEDCIPILAQAIAWMKEGPILLDRKKALFALCSPRQLARLSHGAKLCAIDALGAALGGEAFSSKYSMGTPIGLARSGFQWLWENLPAEEVAQSRAAMGLAFKWAAGKLDGIEIFSNFRTAADNARWSQEVADQEAGSRDSAYDPDEGGLALSGPKAVGNLALASDHMGPLAMKGWSVSFGSMPSPQPQLGQSAMDWARSIDWPRWESRCREMGWTLGTVALSEALDMSRSMPEGASKLDDWFDRCESLLKSPIWDCPGIFSMGPLCDLPLSNSSSPSNVIFNRLVRGWHELPRKAIRDRLAFLGQVGSPISYSSYSKEREQSLRLIQCELNALASGCRSDSGLSEWIKQTAEKCSELLGDDREFDPFSSLSSDGGSLQSIFESLQLAVEGMSLEPLKSASPGRMRL